MPLTVSTHVLDTTTGRPARGVRICLDDADIGVTDEDGRLQMTVASVGRHQLAFATGEYFRRQGVNAFHPEVLVTFVVGEPAEHYHVPLLVSPYAYTTYRGS